MGCEIPKERSQCSRFPLTRGRHIVAFVHHIVHKGKNLIRGNGTNKLQIHIFYRDFFQWNLARHKSSVTFQKSKKRAKILAILTELYLSGSLSFGAAVAGLCTGAGVGLAVLFKYNRHLKENLLLTGILYICAVVTGLLCGVLG